MRKVLKSDKRPFEIKPQQESVWICMCGLSKNQPFCDGSHKTTRDEEDGKTYESTTRKVIDTKYKWLPGANRIRMHLYENHLPVAHTKIAERFYREIVGLPFAYRDATRDIIFLWADVKEKAMIGLWGPDTVYGSHDSVNRKHHLAFAVSLDELLAAIKKLNEYGIETLGFGGEKTDEPTVIGWMPSAQIYFRDPDGHMLEFIAILSDSPDPNFNGRYSEWKKLMTRSAPKAVSGRTVNPLAPKIRDKI